VGRGKGEGVRKVDNRVWSQMPAIPATWEVEAGGQLGQSGTLYLNKENDNKRAGSGGIWLKWQCARLVCRSPGFNPQRDIHDQCTMNECIDYHNKSPTKN
jgi:hypothetical protein